MNLSKWEKNASNLLTSSVEGESKNFHSIVVDVYPDNYGRIEVHITTLFKKPFGQEDSDFYYSQRDKFKKYLKEFLPPINDNNYHIGQGASTIESYETNVKPYYETKKTYKIEEQTLTILKKLNKGLIFEASKKKILVDKIGLSDVAASGLETVAGSLSVLMANKLIEYQLQAIKSWRPETEPSKQDAIDRLNSGNQYHTLLNSLLPKVTEIMDWIRIGLNGNLGEYKNLNFKDLLLKSKEWHDSLGVGKAQINYEEKNPIILDFRNEDGEGFYWVNLQTNNSPEECERMGHCGRTAFNNIIYSLREDKKLPGGKYRVNKSHLTASIGKDGTLYQLKGPKNSKPKHEYHNYILPLFYYQIDDGEYIIDGFGNEYASERDFKLTDLPNEVLVNVYNNRPELFDSRALKRKLHELGIIELPEIDYNIKLEISPDDLGKYVKGDYVLRQRKVNKTTPAGQNYQTTVKTYLFETILSGDAWDLWSNYDADWKSSVDYHLNDENEKRIREILKYFAKKHDTDFDEENFDSSSTFELIQDYDDDHEIRGALSNATNNAESDDYVNHLYKTLKECLEEYGQVEKMDDTGVIINVNVKKYLDEIRSDYLDDYMERCEDDIECVFNEMVSEGDIDRPEFDVDDRWYPDIDDNYFNEMLDDYLGDIEYTHIKK
jgi:hypothetical protein